MIDGRTEGQMEGWLERRVDAILQDPSGYCQESNYNKKTQATVSSFSQKFKKQKKSKKKFKK